MKRFKHIKNVILPIAIGSLLWQPISFAQDEVATLSKQAELNEPAPMQQTFEELLAPMQPTLGPLGPAADEPTELPELAQYWFLLYGGAKLLQPVLTETDLMATFEQDFDSQLLAKAEPDEFFCGVAAEGVTPHNPQEQCEPDNDFFSEDYNKVNQAYVWGMTKANKKIWFGTAANVNCLVAANYIGVSQPDDVEPGDIGVCEYGRSWFSAPESEYEPKLPASLGDWRSPHIYVYNLEENELTLKDDELQAPHDALLQSTLGIRSAGSIGGIVILGGPNLGPGINLFAFNSVTGEFLSSTTLPEYGNIRKWTVARGELYTAVTLTGSGGDFADGGGAVLHWINDPDHSDWPFAFEVVGELDGGGSEIVLHEGRLFVSTWPSLPSNITLENLDSIKLAGLWMSPSVPMLGGLDTSHKEGWVKVWKADDYEPEPLIAITYGGGALASYQGHLFWGTMHVPYSAWAVFMRLYAADIFSAPDRSLARTNATLGTMRPVSIFRGQNFANGNPDIQLLYGMTHLPSYKNGLTPDAAWELAPNNMELPAEIVDNPTAVFDIYLNNYYKNFSGCPIFGLAGFNNYNNNYTWTMAVYNNRLFVGTLDLNFSEAKLSEEDRAELMEFIMALLNGDEIPELGDISEIMAMISDPGGADLYSFSWPYFPASPVSRAGFGNRANYGFRTMVTDRDGLFIGTANPRNLLTDPNEPEGGWELIEIKKKSGWAW